MSQYGIKRNVHRMMLWAAIAAVVLLLLVLAWNTWGVYGKMKEARTEETNAKTELADLKARSTELEASVAALGTDRGVEQEIRTRYPVVRPGETEFVLVPQTASPVDSGHEARESIWGAVLKWMGW